MVLSKHNKIILSCFLFQALSGFVLIGSEKNTLDVTSDRPQSVFYLSTDLPTVSDQATFADGKYASLTKDEFWQQLVKMAMEQWNDVPGSFVRLVLSTDRTASLDSSDQRNSILKSTTLAASLAAVALPQVDRAANLITDCDIQIGSGAQTASVVTYVLMHELGHCLGIGHNHINQNAAMGYTRNSRGLELGLDDKAAAIYLYPSPEYATESNEFAPCGVIAHSNNQTYPQKQTLWFLVPLLFVTFYRRIKIRGREC